ncbi:hypothetical protein BP6252_01970 [Coleophoma cylindrospora]|uniref:Ubiquitin-like domain-containing protein n=1 Tax=Coleophoma cylindrospora TaxID=1849047 RepID=A0A3D8SDH1_9HELO|nr:hypothetical protein BP6252_01970 [Coleophoma cylindrospora]
MPAKRQRTSSDASTADVMEDLKFTNAMIHPVYKTLLAHAPNSIEFLFSTRLYDVLKESASQDRITRTFNVTIERAVEELRRLLAIKTFMRDHDADKTSPTPLMRHMWHTAILDTRLYSDLQKALECVLHNRLGVASDADAEVRKLRLETMKALYTAYFSETPVGFPKATYESPGLTTSTERTANDKAKGPPKPATSTERTANDKAEEPPKPATSTDPATNDKAKNATTPTGTSSQSNQKAREASTTPTAPENEHSTAGNISYIVRHAQGREWFFTGSNMITIDELIGKIQSTVGRPLRVPKLYFDGVRLDREKTLRDYDITDCKFMILLEDDVAGC